MDNDKKQLVRSSGQCPVPVTVSEAWYDRLYARDQDFWLSVAAMLQLMQKAGLPMSADRAKHFDAEDPETVGLYVLDLADAGIEMADIDRDGHAVRRKLRFFPSSGELSRTMVALKQKVCPPGVIMEPVYVWDGSSARVCSKRIAEKQKLPHWSSERDCLVANGAREPMKALPVGTMADLNEHLEGLGSRMRMSRLPLRPSREFTPAQVAAAEAELAEAAARYQARQAAG